MNDIHVMNAEELRSVPDGYVVWMESRYFQTNPMIPGAHQLQPLVKYSDVYGNYFSYMIPDEVDEESDVRFWSHRPTIETMNKEPWRNV